MINKIDILDILLSLINNKNNAISANIINLIYIYNQNKEYYKETENYLCMSRKNLY